MAVIKNKTGSVTPGGLWHPKQNGVWESAVFTVPHDTTQDKVDFHAHKYMQRAGEAWEHQGFTVLKLTKPAPDKVPMGVDPDRKRYVMWGFLRRKPQEITVEVPDAAVPTLTRQGMNLI